MKPQLNWKPVMTFFGLALGLMACVDPPTATPSFDLVVTPTSLSAKPSETSSKINFSVVRKNGFANAVETVLATNTILGTTSNKIKVNTSQSNPDTGTLEFEIGADVTPQIYNLELRASAGNIAKTTPILLEIKAKVATPPSTGPTSFELIDVAVQNGTLNAETALTYKVFVTFGDPRLPQAYQGNTNEQIDNDALEQVYDQWASLSSETKSTLTPFLMRPSSVGSWVDTTAKQFNLKKPKSNERPDTCKGVRTDWSNAATISSPVKVWYQQNQKAKAEALQAEFDTKIWKVLIDDLKFREPPSDYKNNDCDGGDSRLDIYLVPSATYTSKKGLNTLGVAIYEPPLIAGNTGSRFVFIRDDLVGDNLYGTATHEFFHAVQQAYTPKTNWLIEATADWAIDAVYDMNNQSEQTNVKCYVESMQQSLQDKNDPLCQGDLRQYGAYVFFQFLAKTSDKTIVRSIFEQLALGKDFYNAIDMALGNKLKDKWKEFAQAWMPQNDGFSKFFRWDILIDDKPHKSPNNKINRDLDLSGAKYLKTELPSKLEHLSASHHDFIVLDEKTRSVMVHNTFYDNYKSNEKVAVQAAYKLSGETTWTYEDWTDKEWIGFCRDRKQERIVELVIAFSSGEWDSSQKTIQASKPPTIERNNIGCYEYHGDMREETAFQGTVQQTTTSSNVIFRPLGSYTDGKYLHVMAPQLVLQSAQIDMIEEYTRGKCLYKASTGFSATNSPAMGGFIMINYFPESVPPEAKPVVEELLGVDSMFAYTGLGVSTKKVTGTVTGPRPGCPTTYETIVGSLLFTSINELFPKPKVNQDGHLVGTYTYLNSTSTWNLTPFREP